MEQNDAEVNQMLKVCSNAGQNEKNMASLRSKISLSNLQMLQLTHNNQKFTNQVSQLNEKGINSIHHGNYQQALLYLEQAEKLLEYAASCGRAIDREVIIKILNNEAVVYQKTWDLEKIISYIEAIIFNLQTFLNSSENLDLIEGLKKKIKESENSSYKQEDFMQYLKAQFEKLKRILSKKYQLSLYLLQFSCLSSQNQHHEFALNNAKQALKSFRDVFELSLIFLKLKKCIKIEISEECFKLLQQVTSIYQFKPLKNLHIAKQLQEIQKAFEKKSQAPSSFNYILQKYSSLENKEAKHKNFSLASVIELKPKSMNERTFVDRPRNIQDWHFIEEIENFSVLSQKVLEYAVTFFTISVEMNEINAKSIPPPSILLLSQKQSHPQNEQKTLESQLFYLLSLKLSVCLVEQLSQFSFYTYKHYCQIYNQKNFKKSFEMSKMDMLKEKYKKYLPGEKGNNISQDQSQNFQESDDEFCDNNISEYSISIKLSIINQPKDSKENKLEKLFKENSISTPDNTVNPVPPKLQIDLSEIESLEYGGSNTFKKNSGISNNLSPSDIIEQEEEDHKQKRKINCLNVKKMKTLPNLSDGSLNKDSRSQSKENQSKVEKIKKFEQKSRSKQNLSKKNKKSNSITSPQKLQIKIYRSPRPFNLKSFEINTTPQGSETEVKKKSNITEKKILFDKKTLLNVEKQPQTFKKDKKLLIFKEKKKKSYPIIIPQLSARKISSKDETLHNLQKQRGSNIFSTKRISKLRKTKSFEHIINPFEDIKPIIYRSKVISDTFNIQHKKNLKEKLKYFPEIKSVKSSENLMSKVSNRKKDKKKNRKIEGLRNIMSQNIEARKFMEIKDSAIKKTRKSNVSLDKEQKYRSTIMCHKKAARMSNGNNHINIANEKQLMKKINSSKSLHQSNYFSGYLLKGLNTTTSQKTKAESIITKHSIKKK